jgi:hypothetical protein
MSRRKWFGRDHDREDARALIVQRQGTARLRGGATCSRGKMAKAI